MILSVKKINATHLFVSNFFTKYITGYTAGGERTAITLNEDVDLNYAFYYIRSVLAKDYPILKLFVEYLSHVPFDHIDHVAQLCLLTQTQKIPFLFNREHRFNLGQWIMKHPQKSPYFQHRAELFPNEVILADKKISQEMAEKINLFSGNLFDCLKQPFCSENVVIAGGCLVACSQTTVKMAPEYFKKNFVESDIDLWIIGDEKKRYETVREIVKYFSFMSGVNYCFRGAVLDIEIKGRRSIQIIMTSYRDPCEVIEKFDMPHLRMFFYKGYFCSTAGVSEILSTKKIPFDCYVTAKRRKKWGKRGFQFGPDIFKVSGKKFYGGINNLNTKNKYYTASVKTSSNYSPKLSKKETSLNIASGIKRKTLSGKSLALLYEAINDMNAMNAMISDNLPFMMKKVDSFLRVPVQKRMMTMWPERRVVTLVHLEQEARLAIRFSPFFLFATQAQILKVVSFGTKDGGYMVVNNRYLSLFREAYQKYIQEQRLLFFPEMKKILEKKEDFWKKMYLKRNDCDCSLEELTLEPEEKKELQEEYVSEWFYFSTWNNSQKDTFFPNETNVCIQVTKDQIKKIEKGKIYSFSFIIGLSGATKLWKISAEE